MKRTELQTALDANIPRDAIETREQAGRSLSYLATWYVIDRLNQVLGQGNWSYSIKTLTRVFEGNQTQRSGGVFATSYTAIVALTASFDGNVVTFEDVGYGDGTDKSSPGKAHELATKEAVSDALKRAAKNLGRSMGLALYDKSQEFVGITAVAPAPTKTETGTIQPKLVKQVAKAQPAAPVNAPPAPVASVKAAPVVKTQESAAPRPLAGLLRSGFKVAEQKGLIDAPTFRTKYTFDKGLSVLEPQELATAYSMFQQDFPEIKL